MRGYLRAMLQWCCRRVWFPTALGWGLYGLAVFLGGLTLYPHYPEAFCIVVNILTIMMLSGGVAAHIVGVVRSMRALRQGAVPRWEIVIAAVSSWGGVGLALCAAVILVLTLNRIL